MVISTKSISKEFKPNKFAIWKKNKKKIQALDNITLEVKSGEVFGLLGKNGAGKTTLIRILVGLIKQTEGSAEIFGQNISKEILSKTN